MKIIFHFLKKLKNKQWQHVTQNPIQNLPITT